MKAWLLAACVVRTAALTVAVTHAAGRMGVSVVGQLREQWQIDADPDEALTIRAIVRSAAEASRLQLDLCGAVLRDGKLHPLLDLREDLGIEVCVVPDDMDEQVGLAGAFDGSDVAVLLSAAHADFSTEVSEGAQFDASEVVPGKTFHERAERAYTNAYKAAAAVGGASINVRVPPLAGATAARRLNAEVAAMVTASTVQHVVMRSSMGVSALCSSEPATTQAAEQGADEQLLTATAVARMGGAANLGAQADAESAMQSRCAQRGVACTVLRLGALVDSAGGVPLAFGSQDAQLLERVADELAVEPPLISRNDAARLVVQVALKGNPRLAGATIDAAWDAKWGMSSAGVEEASRTAARQDLIMAAAGTLATSS